MAEATAAREETQARAAGSMGDAASTATATATAAGASELQARLAKAEARAEAAEATAVAAEAETAAARQERDEQVGRLLFAAEAAREALEAEERARRVAVAAAAWQTARLQEQLATAEARRAHAAAEAQAAAREMAAAREAAMAAMAAPSPVAVEDGIIAAKPPPVPPAPKSPAAAADDAPAHPMMMRARSTSLAKLQEAADAARAAANEPDVVEVTRAARAESEAAVERTAKERSTARPGAPHGADLLKLESAVAEAAAAAPEATASVSAAAETGGAPRVRFDDSATEPAVDETGADAEDEDEGGGEGEGEGEEAESEAHTWTATKWVESLPTVSKLISDAILAGLGPDADGKGPSEALHLQYVRQLGSWDSYEPLLASLKQGQLLEELAGAAWRSAKELVQQMASTASELRDKFIQDSSTFKLTLGDLKTFAGARGVHRPAAAQPARGDAARALPLQGLADAVLREELRDRDDERHRVVVRRRPGARPQGARSAEVAARAAAAPRALAGQHDARQDAAARPARRLRAAPPRHQRGARDARRAALRGGGHRGAALHRARVHKVQLRAAWRRDGAPQHHPAVPQRVARAVPGQQVHDDHPLHRLMHRQVLEAHAVRDRVPWALGRRAARRLLALGRVQRARRLRVLLLVHVARAQRRARVRGAPQVRRHRLRDQHGRDEPWRPHGMAQPVYAPRFGARTLLPPLQPRCICRAHASLAHPHAHPRTIEQTRTRRRSSSARLRCSSCRRRASRAPRSS